MIVRLAKTQEDLRKVWRLTHDMYVAQGYSSPQGNGLLQQHAQLERQRETEVFLAIGAHDKILGSASASMDGACGLPFEDVFRAQVEGIRKESVAQGHRLGAIWRLVTRPESRHDFLVAMALYSAMLKWGAKANWHTVLCTCHPRHQSFYVRYFGFQAVGDAVVHPVYRAPAILMKGEIKTCQKVWLKIGRRRSSVRMTGTAIEV